ncbi:ISL3 family transposase [Fulvitalea axinellae]|uniref:ISL3 family transposase n=1 Tax=Fulvitalea axinellae TaxID=1182444 RepID=UPI0030CA52B9
MQNDGRRILRVNSAPTLSEGGICSARSKEDRYSLPNYRECPVCLKKRETINQYSLHKYQDLSISGKEVWLHVRVPQFVCEGCGRYFLHRPEWASSGKSHTDRQSKWIFELCAKQSFSEVAALVNACHKTVERIYFRHANKAVDLLGRYARVRKLGIDELAHRKGKKDYVCVLTDLERGIHLDILKDRKKETIRSHFQSLGNGFMRRIEVVACDIWRPYIDVCEACFPNAAVVIDYFHVVKSLNDSLDGIRKKLRKEHKDTDCFKNIKWALFKRPDHCCSRQRESLGRAFRDSALLKDAYDLRNEFLEIMDFSETKVSDEKRLDQWIEKARDVNQKGFNRFVKTLCRWRTQIWAFTQTGVTNAMTEGLNNMIRYYKRISFGIPNFEHMRIRVLVSGI